MGLLGLELQAVVSRTTLVMGSDHGPSGEKGLLLATEPSFSLPSIGITGMSHHARLIWHFIVLCTVRERGVF